MSTELFPVLPGLTWDIQRSPIFSTQIQTSPSGHEIRASFYSQPLFQWQMTYEFLDQRTGYNELRTLQDFFTARLGSYDCFYFSDPSEVTINTLALGVGDGSTKIFTICAPLAPQQLFHPENSWTYAPPAVYEAGVLVPPGHYTVSYPDQYSIRVTFGNSYAPTDHALLTLGDVPVWWLARFDQDQVDFNNFMYRLWELQTLRLRSIKGVPVSGSSSLNVATGSILLYAGSSIPDGFLPCDGAAVSRSTYSDLFGVIGTTYGLGDNTTTFNVPDFRGRSPLGVGHGTDLTNRALGDKGGEETHLLITGEMPSHTHSFPDDVAKTTGPYSLNASGGTIGTETPTLGSAGGDTAHNTMHPFLSVNHIIKT